MRYRLLGTSGVRVSELALGTMTFGDPDRLDALSRPTFGFPADVMREASFVGGVYGVQLPDIDDPRAEAVRYRAKLDEGD